MGDAQNFFRARFELFAIEEIRTRQYFFIIKIQYTAHRVDYT